MPVSIHERFANPYEVLGENAVFASSAAAPKKKRFLHMLETPIDNVLKNGIIAIQVGSGVRISHGPDF